MSSLSSAERTRRAEFGASELIYQRGAPIYTKLGWSPLPGEGKRPKVDGHHGKHGSYPYPDEIAAWASTGGFPGHNVVLRLPKNVIGIDVDAYDGKHGAETIAALEARVGVKLPPTYVSTARGKDSGSGIRFYRVPEGLSWRSNLGQESGVEIIAWYLRVAAVAPSIHAKLGTMYQWFGPTGEEDTPRPGDLTELPAPFVVELSKGAYVHRPKGTATDEEALAWLGEDVEPCNETARWLKYWTDQLTAESSLHDTARNGIRALVGERAKGHVGTRQALRELHAAFVGAMEDYRPREEAALAQDYFMRAMYGGIRLEADDDVWYDDPCVEDDALFAGEMQVSTQDGARAVPKTSYTTDDVGNSRRLMDALAGDGKFIEAWGEWVLYDAASALWVRDPGGHLILDRMVTVTDRMRTEAGNSGDPKAALSWARSSRSAGKLRAAADLAKGRSLGRAEEYDADPTALHVASGVLELLPDGAKYRPRTRADMASLCAPAPYRPWAEVRRTSEAREWLRFLRRVQPDEDDRRWVQTLAGYSLLGRNPERAFVLAIGPTSSGKTTFAEAIRGAVGDYVGVVNLSLFRDKQDEGPRADLVEALAKRLVYAVETSAHAVLHAENVKRLTGGDPLKARRLHSNVMVERIPAFTPWLLTNETPTVPGADLAVHRRLVAVRFGVSLAPHEIDVSLPVRLAAPEARAAILAWVIDGWDLYCRDGLREAPASAMDARQDAINAMSTLGLFLNECCETGPADDGYTVTSADLHTRYLAWLVDTGVEDRRTASKPAFGRAVGAHGFARVKAEGGAVRAWGGLRVRGSVPRTDRAGPRRGPTDQSEDRWPG